VIFRNYLGVLVFGFDLYEFFSCIYKVEAYGFYKLKIKLIFD